MRKITKPESDKPPKPRAEPSSASSAQKPAQPSAPPNPSTTADRPAANPGKTPPATPKATPRRSSLVPALIGGFLAACLGFLAARSDILDPILPAALKGPDFAVISAELRQSDRQQASNLAALKAELAAIEPADLAPITAQITALTAENTALKAELTAREAHLRDLEARLNPLDIRLSELEKRPMTDGASEAAIAAYDRELAALSAAIAAQRADVENLISEARATEAEARASEENAIIVARRADIQAAMTRLKTALENGAPYQQALDEMASAGINIPDVLKKLAGEGVASLGALGADFPKAARAALSATRAGAGDSGGIAGFFQRQLGARSVQPREGDDPDAILSRAEAALNDGQLDQALKELSGLPEVARDQMQEWVDHAATRQTALQAANELAQSLNSN
ncbi:MAG: hypothetical protein L3J36_04945 [Rhodobacteraceae bacterium]|nr:hypothetical protein [Paracoccaceae bacterium]